MAISLYLPCFAVQWGVIWASLLNSPAAATNLLQRTGTAETLRHLKKKCGTPKGRAGLSKQEVFGATSASRPPNSSPGSRWIETYFQISRREDFNSRRYLRASQLDISRPEVWLGYFTSVVRASSVC